MTSMISSRFLAITILSVGLELLSSLSLIATASMVPVQQQTQEQLAKQFPIVQCPFRPTTHERILLARLRDCMTSTKAFRVATAHIGELLVTKVIECLETQAVEVQTPTASCRGEVIAHPIELVSILRSGDALLDTFMSHFPDAHVTKVLVQKNEETAHPVFSYMKLSPSIASGATVLVLDPMIATGDTLHTVLSLLKEKGVQDENIIVACIATCPEGLRELCAHHPAIRLVMNVLDEKLNEKKCIVPGLGDFGDRYYGTPKPQP